MAWDGAPPRDDTPWPDDEEGAQQVVPLTVTEMDGGPIPLGYDRDNRNYYLSVERGIVTSLTAAQHTEPNLCNIAPLDWYRSHFRSKGKTPFRMVAETLFRLTGEAGIFDHERLRGRGAHMDSGHIVLHLGNEVLCAGRSYRPGISPAQGSPAIYESGSRLNMTDAKPLGNSEAVKFFELLDECSWKSSDMAPLIAGWAVVAPFCGALDFRPYLWVTGQSGSGKNWVITNLVRPALANFLVSSTIGTTAAGARRHLKLDALPLWFNEAESENEGSAAKIAEMIRLARSSSDGDAMTIMGDGPNGSSNIFMTKSMFLFSSTVHSLQATADINRTVHVELVQNTDTDWFKDFKRRVKSTMTQEFCDRLIARSFKLLPIIIKNIEVLRDALSDEMVSSRIADTLAPMMAGFASLKGQRILSPEEAVELVRSREWIRRAASSVQDQSVPEYDKVLDHLLTRIIGVSPGVTKSIAEWIDIVLREAPGIPTSENRALLFRHGIGIEGDSQAPTIVLCRSHPQLDRIFSTTPWAEGRWSRTIAQNPAITEGRKQKFGAASPRRTLSIPSSIITRD